MFYKQFLEITDVLNSSFVENFDYWLATLPRNNQKNITISMVSARLGVKYSLAEYILKFAEEQKILKRYYIVKCPDCDYPIDTISKEELSDFLMNPVYCDECNEYKHILPNDIYVAYKVILQPDVTEDEITAEIEKKLNSNKNIKVNFSHADSLSNNTIFIYEAFYNPDESAYSKFKELREKLDSDYGNNTTAQGNSLELLVLEIFNSVKIISATNDIKTKTNQFDCTALCSLDSVYPSVFNYLFPYFIIECKNEKKKPDNTYMNKLESILDTNEAQVGIIFGRKNATKACFNISREHYLIKKDSIRKKIIITCCDDDLNYIIDKKVNLLQYIEFKIFQITSNSPSSTFEMFIKNHS